jgi:hypothetical protein
VRRRQRAREDVGDDQVVAVFPDGLDDLAGIRGAHPDPVPGGQRQVRADQFGELIVEFGDELPGARTGVREIPGEGERPAAEVQRAQRLARRERQVDRVPDAAYVLELQVPGVFEVDAALRDTVDEQQPRVRSVDIWDKFR